MMRDQAIRNTHPSVRMILEERFAFDNDGNPVAIDEFLVAAEIARLQAAYDDTQYQRDRVKEYPSLSDQLDLLYWDKVNGTNNWQTAIQAVKDKYPKP